MSNSFVSQLRLSNAVQSENLFNPSLLWRFFIKCEGNLPIRIIQFKTHSFIISFVWNISRTLQLFAIIVEFECKCSKLIIKVIRPVFFTLLNRILMIKDILSRSCFMQICTYKITFTFFNWNSIVFVFP